MAGALPRESLPCAEAPPAPLPPPSPCCSPDPCVALTPERAAGGILRRGEQEKPRPRHVSFRFPELPRARKEEPPAPLGSPLPHSSLLLGAEVRAARARAFDARQAAERLVRHSFGARCAAEARVGEGLNIPREQRLYRGLVSLRVPTEEVLSCAVQERFALAQYPSSGERKGAPTEGPDVMAFYRPEELFTETPFLDVGGLPPLKLQARRRAPETAFLMHRKLQQWAG